MTVLAIHKSALADPPKTASTPAPSTDPLLVSRRGLAQMLAVSVPTIDRMRAAGKLPRGIKIGGSLRYDRREIEKWLRHRRTDGTLPTALEWEAIR